MKLKKIKKRSNKLREITDYDRTDTVGMIGSEGSIRFEDLGLTLPEQPTTQVVSIRLPTALLNEIKAFGSKRDIPYQALIKLFLSDAIAERRRRGA